MNDDLETTSGREGGIDLACEPNPCPLCGDEKGIKKYNHCYSCATLWRRRRENRDATYTEKETCGSCMFYHAPMGTPLDFFVCRLPMGDKDDDREFMRRRRVKSNGVCAEFRHKKSDRQSDNPWASHPKEYFDWDDDTDLSPKTEKEL